MEEPTTGPAEDNTARNEAGVDPRMILAGILSGSGPRNIHEIGVQGSVIEQTKNLLETYMKSELISIDTPEGLTVPAIVSRTGIDVMDPDDFDQWRDNPRFRTGTAALLDLDSFIAHVNRFKDSDSIIFADNNRSAPKLGAVFDYHRERKGGGDAEPRAMRHKNVFAFPLSDEWKAWQSADKQAMKMADFARFLEDRIIDVLPHEAIALGEVEQRFVNTLGGMGRIASPAKLMELATGLQVYEETEVTNAVKLQTGEARMTFQNRQHDGQGGDLNVPSMFVLALPVFVNGPAYQVIARLRFRKVGGDLMFWVELWRTDRVFDHAFTEALQKVKDETALPVMLGRAEA